MKFTILDPQKFDEFSKKHSYGSFQQTSHWGKVKENVGWKSLILGYENQEGDIIAGGLFLGKKIPFLNQYLFYCPHGYLLDFENTELWKSFQRDLIIALKKEKAFSLIIDPYIPYQQRDIEGKIINESWNNQKIVDIFQQLGFKHTGFVLDFDNLQPRFHFRLPLDRSYHDLEKNFKYEAKRRIHKKDYLGITIRELAENEISDYKKLMEMTASRRGFIDRPLSYYQNMYACLHSAGILQFMAAEIDFATCLKNVEEDITSIQAKLAQLKEKNSNSVKILNRIHEEEIVLQKAKNLQERVLKARQQKGEVALLSVVCLLNYGKESVMLLAGNDEEYLQDFNTSNIIVGELIKKAVEEGYAYYNFYGITGYFDANHELYGLYSYKKQYGGEVVEYIGQFELVLNKGIHKLYETALRFYRWLRK